MNKVLNSTVVSNFAAIGKMGLLRVVAAPLYLPAAVYEEIQDGQLAGYSFYDEREIYLSLHRGGLAAFSYDDR